MTAQRRTRQKDAIARIMQTFEDFRSAQQIHLALSEDGETIGLATVYRNLQSMTDAKQLETVRSEHGEQLYRLCPSHDHHHHLVCRKCGYSVDVKTCEFEKLVSKLAKQNGFTEVEHSADIFGLCQKCSNHS